MSENKRSVTNVAEIPYPQWISVKSWNPITINVQYVEWELCFNEYFLLHFYDFTYVRFSLFTEGLNFMLL